VNPITARLTINNGTRMVLSLPVFALVEAVRMGMLTAAPP
jgi:hypothetical protein